jgi:hypothetical protein
MGEQFTELYAILAEDANTSAVFDFYTTRPERDADRILDLATEVHHSVWAYSTDTEAVCRVHPSAREDELWVLVSPKGRGQITAVTGVRDSLLEQVIVSSVEAAYSRLLTISSQETAPVDRLAAAAAAVVVAFEDTKHEHRFTVHPPQHSLVAVAS